MSDRMSTYPDLDDPYDEGDARRWWVRPPSRVGLSAWVSANAILVVLLVLIAAIAIYDTDFISANSVRNILTNSSTRLLVALGAGIVLISRGVDLSGGRMVGLAAVVSASMLQSENYSRLFYPDLPALPLILPILVAVGATTILGIVNGVVVAKLRVPPFIATLGMMVIAFGITAIYFDQEPNRSQPLAGIREDLSYLGTGAFAVGPVSIPILVAVAGTAAVLMWVLLSKTVFGKNVYAIGGNPQAAQVSGVNIARTLIAVYAIAGACYGVAGVLEAARTGGASSRYGELYELDAIAACVVGGVSTAGGIGRVRGIVAGVLVFSVISYGLTFIGINPFWQQIIKGVIIISAVAFDMARSRGRR
jgi:methyl-galactoside transport system permease protein